MFATFVVEKKWKQTTNKPKSK